jgi:ribonuclease R
LETDSHHVLRELSAAADGRLSFHELCARLFVPPKHRPRFRNLLRRMLREGSIRSGKGHTYRLGQQVRKDAAWAIEGVVRRHPDGFGFLVPEEGEDLFLPAREIDDVFDGDRVRAVPVPGKFGRTSGRIVAIVERARRFVTGIYRKIGIQERVFPSTPVFGDPIELVPGAVEPRDGEIVELEIRQYPEGPRPAVGRIVEILGNQGELGALIETVIRKHGLPRRFPDDVLEEAESISEDALEPEIRRRVDLRDEPTFTIDGEDARDFDDAVAIAPLPHGGMRLRVSIADVAQWVAGGSSLDREAFDRGTSVYFPDRVIPMLPERLSNGIASLRPGEDRLTVTIEMEFDDRGRRTASKLFESVIRSAGRWTYKAVARVLEGETVEGISEHRDTVSAMAALMTRLRRLRQERGSLDFDLPEPDIVLDDLGEPEDVLRSERNDAHRIIEEFMIAANEAVADWFVARHLPTIFRTHAPPDIEKMRNFLEFAKSYGYVAKFGTLASSTALAEFLEDIRGMPAERALNHILLRSMMRAEYSTENIGHYGLASERYLHFTSPIRRYPDLIVHRLAKKALRRSERSGDSSQLAKIATQSTQREVRALKCEFDVLDVMRAYFLAGRVGEEFDGVISGVIEEGFFVELLDYFVEGMVRMEDLHDDWYRYLPEPKLLVGRRTRKRFAIGDPVRVAVQAVHVELGRIELSLVRGGSRGVTKGKPPPGRGVRRGRRTRNERA